MDMLSRIGSTLGKSPFSYQFTIDKSKLGFAKVLIEMELNGKFPEEVILEDELGEQFFQLSHV